MGTLLHCIGVMCLMLNLQQFKDEIIVPTLQEMDMYSPAAVNLLLGTAVQESMFHMLIDHEEPAYGVYQIEATTHIDIYDNYLIYNSEIRNKVYAYSKFGTDEELIWNLKYATIIARLVYYRHKEPLPDADDIAALARYWKKYYNTRKGKGTAAQFALKYREYIRGKIK